MCWFILYNNNFTVFYGKSSEYVPKWHFNVLITKCNFWFIKFFNSKKLFTKTESKLNLLAKPIIKGLKNEYVIHILMMTILIT